MRKSVVVGFSMMTLVGLVAAACSTTTGELACGQGSVECGGACTVVARDPENCGACGTKCAAGQVCSQGTCAIECGNGTTKCGAACIDTKVDGDNCGACGTKCAAGQVCSKGACATNCAATQTKCGNGCVDLKNDVTNCGACGTTCKGGETCSAGTCALTCQAELTKCSAPAQDGGAGDGGGDAGTGEFCTNLQTDVTNCGGCGNVCAKNCSNGVCCDPGFVGCGNQCFDVQSDPKNCGACGKVCQGSDFCSYGACSKYIGPLAGTESSNTNATNGQFHNGVAADPVTKKVYFFPNYTGQTATVFADAPALVANAGPSALALPVGREGTYHAVVNGFLYYPQYNTGILQKVDTSTSTVVKSAALPGAGHTNAAYFQWGGYTDIDFFVDVGNRLYVLYAATIAASMQLSLLDQGTLAPIRTWTIPRTKANTSFAFLVNGVMYFGTFQSPTINGAYVLATSTYDSTYTNTLTSVASNYITHMQWDPTTKNLFEASDNRIVIYPNVK